MSVCVLTRPVSSGRLHRGLQGRVSIRGTGPPPSVLRAGARGLFPFSMPAPLDPPGSSLGLNDKCMQTEACKREPALVRLVRAGAGASARWGPLPEAGEGERGEGLRGRRAAPAVHARALAGPEPRRFRSHDTLRRGGGRSLASSRERRRGNGAAGAGGRGMADVMVYGKEGSSRLGWTRLRRARSPLGVGRRARRRARSLTVGSQRRLRLRLQQAEAAGVAWLDDEEAAEALVVGADWSAREKKARKKKARRRERAEREREQQRLEREEREWRQLRQLRELRTRRERDENAEELAAPAASAVPRPEAADESDGPEEPPRVPGQSEPFLVRGKAGLLLLLSHTQSLTFTGKCRMTCLYGRVQIFGFIINQGHPPYELYSPHTNCALSIEAISYVLPEKTLKDMKLEVRSLIKDHLSSANANNVIKQFSPMCSIVLLESLETPATDFILSYPAFSHLFSGKKQEMSSYSLEQLTMSSVGIKKCGEENGFHLSESSSSVIEELITACREEIDGCPIIMACGPKCIGKSTFNRYLINRLLNIIPCVDFLDCDLGQTEFTPPGCVSLSNVIEPILGPPFTHQRKTRKMVFYGDSSCEDDCKKYTEIVKYVFSAYQREAPLIINTMGWVKGDGLLLLIDLIRMLAPTHVVQFSSEQCQEMPLLTPDYVAGMEGLQTKGKTRVRNKHLDCRESESSGDPDEGSQFPTAGHKLLLVQSEFAGAGVAQLTQWHSPVLRDMALLGYLALLQPPEAKPFFPLHHLVPFQIPFSSVALRVIHTDVAPTHTMYTVNASWIGLCRILDDVKQKTDGPVFLTDNPVCDCVGFGIIRGISMVKKVYYILTPLSHEKLRHVNCLMIGNITIPHCVFKNQPKIEGDIPYVTSEYNFSIWGSGKLRVRKLLQRREYL
ncbi:polynucleotide 5'-hydroxyl-kinase NOL9 [Dromiciops gliroides]|uniref:polynucleotide 5'-hydroxyl-kinase NOL9 n=1 Tax=Dromiciops gliroides TaxID=33562 RepID=UPI001CC46C59|nr:polynucleotide 5'-hydroxyl-kinase NOL9 [Dromiciops gliroides]